MTSPTDDVARLRALLGAATPGPWNVGPGPHFELEDGEGRPLRLTWFGHDAAFVGAARNALPGLLDRLEAAERDLADVMRFMGGVREAALNRNPEGATILDFLVCWNEQYEARAKAAERDRDRLAAEVKRLRSNVVPGLTYACGCQAVSSGSIAAFCPTHLEPIRAALTPGEARP